MRISLIFTLGLLAIGPLFGFLLTRAVLAYRRGQELRCAVWGAAAAVEVLVIVASLPSLLLWALRSAVGLAP